MKMKGCKTIAEFAIKTWMQDNGFAMSEFDVEMDGNKATITDTTGDSMNIFYDKKERKVVIKDD